MENINNKNFYHSINSLYEDSIQSFSKGEIEIDPREIT